MKPMTKANFVLSVLNIFVRTVSNIISGVLNIIVYNAFQSSKQKTLLVNIGPMMFGKTRIVTSTNWRENLICGSCDFHCKNDSSRCHLDKCGLCCHPLEFKFQKSNFDTLVCF